MISGTWHNSDPIGRADNVRRLVKELAARHGVDEAALGRICGYTRQRWATLLTYGERAAPRLSDLALLSAALGAEDELLHAAARSLGYRLVRESQGPGGGDALDAARAAVQETAALLARCAELVGRTVLPGDATDLGAAMDRARRHLSRLEAAVADQVVEPGAAAVRRVR